MLPTRLSAWPSRRSSIWGGSKTLFPHGSPFLYYVFYIVELKNNRYGIYFEPLRLRHWYSWWHYWHQCIYLILVANYHYFWIVMRFMLISPGLLTTNTSGKVIYNECDTPRKHYKSLLISPGLFDRYQHLSGRGRPL